MAQVVQADTGKAGGLAQADPSRVDVAAMTIAEFFRDRGENVLLILDSVTRFAHAARDVALAAGEPAVARGYAPSVFSDLPKLLEFFDVGATPGENHTITHSLSTIVIAPDGKVAQWYPTNDWNPQAVLNELKRVAEGAKG